MAPIKINSSVLFNNHHQCTWTMGSHIFTGGEMVVLNPVESHWGNYFPLGVGYGLTFLNFFFPRRFRQTQLYLKGNLFRIQRKKCSFEVYFCWQPCRLKASSILLPGVPPCRARKLASQRRLHAAV